MAQILQWWCFSNSKKIKHNRHFVLNKHSFKHPAYLINDNLPMLASLSRIPQKAFIYFEICNLNLGSA